MNMSETIICPKCGADRPTGVACQNKDCTDYIQPTVDAQIADWMATMAQREREQREFRMRCEAILNEQPQAHACPKHPSQLLAINDEESVRRSYIESERIQEENFITVYHACPECTREAKLSKAEAWLHSMGVPAILSHAEFAHFRIENPEDIANLADARRFAKKAKGFLLMVGALGDGKSLLAAATLRALGGGLFITHNELLIAQRRSYDDPKAVDVIQKAQRARCLVLDDLGLSMGGRDELPMLQAILDYRHGDRLPTVITSNLQLEEIYGLLGPRLTDRLKQATYRVLRFSGPSSRPGEKQSYLG